ncbi:MAG: hypothetical protein H6720_23235 [Sandaracinus sp.]|nr:hypothetical protein [Sandaracinus sp.]
MRDAEAGGAQVVERVERDGDEVVHDALEDDRALPPEADPEDRVGRVLRELRVTVARAEHDLAGEVEPAHLPDATRDLVGDRFVREREVGFDDQHRLAARFEREHLAALTSLDAVRRHEGAGELVEATVGARALAEEVGATRVRAERGADRRAQPSFGGPCPQRARLHDPAASRGRRRVLVGAMRGRDGLRGKRGVDLRLPAVLGPRIDLDDAVVVTTTEPGPQAERKQDEPTRAHAGRVNAPLLAGGAHVASSSQAKGSTAPAPGSLPSAREPGFTDRPLGSRVSARSVHAVFHLGLGSAMISGLLRLAPVLLKRSGQRNRAHPTPRGIR